MTKRQRKDKIKENKERKRIAGYPDEYIDTLIINKNKEIANTEGVISVSGLLCAMFVFCGFCLSFASTPVALIIAALGAISAGNAFAKHIKLKNDQKYVKLLNEEQAKRYEEFQNKFQKELKASLNLKPEVVVAKTKVSEVDAEQNLEL